MAGPAANWKFSSRRIAAWRALARQKWQLSLGDMTAEAHGERHKYLFENHAHETGFKYSDKFFRFCEARYSSIFCVVTVLNCGSTVAAER